MIYACHVLFLRKTLSLQSHSLETHSGEEWVTVIFATGCKPEDDPSNGGGNNDGGKTPTVTTMSVTDITTNSAKCGGTVTDEGDDSVTERGICWSTSQMPTINGSYLTCGSGTGSFEGEMLQLLENTVYYVRAYATNSVGTSYGEEVSFQTEESVYIYTIEVLADPSEYGEVIGGGSYQQGDTCTVIAKANDGYSFVNWTVNGDVVSSEESYTFTVTSDWTLIANFDYAFVDLGLPNGTLWAAYNVGATTPEGYGDYFAWGETQTKSTYTWGTYQYCNGDSNQLTKYCSDSNLGYNGFTDNSTTLLPEDDAAMANWGNGWCMPTADQWRELKDNTSCVWTMQNGVYGRLFTAVNGNTLFLPAAGNIWDNEFHLVGDYGGYWSSSLYIDNPCNAWSFDFFSENYNVGFFYRYDGQPVRAVRSTSQN